MVTIESGCVIDKYSLYRQQRNGSEWNATLKDSPHKCGCCVSGWCQDEAEYQLHPQWYIYVYLPQCEPTINMFSNLFEIAATLVLSVLLLSLMDHQRLLFHGLLLVQAWIFPIFKSL